MKIKITIIALIITGCVSSQSLVDSAQHIESGMNQAQVDKIMDYPYKVETFKSGNEFDTIWIYSKPESYGGYCCSLTPFTWVYFKNGVVRDIQIAQ